MATRDGLIKGISVCNPVDIDRDYLLFTVDYAKENGFDHMQVIGPIHDPVKGNIDGMTVYRKYSYFNNTKEMDFANKTNQYLNEACEKAAKNGIKVFVWHHELDLPNGFGEAFPEVLNEYGDYEVSHPIIKDFLENKIIDFFHDYKKVDGIILTLHETKVPLLKLKSQKLDKIERVKYVTQILFDTCKSLGKTLIVRPFASLEEDYSMMMQAYEEISHELIVMDKWTQFDWSLTMPHNSFFKKIKNNPLLIETDIFGEFFGKGRLPLMLKNHIKEKTSYCNSFNPAGYVSRIDRNGNDPFGEVNQVNINIISAHMNGWNVDEEIFKFFQNKYPNAAKEVMEIMDGTEDVLEKIIYLKGYYFTELSYFPTLNHSKNHFYFEMMKENFDIASNEWFIPINWNRGSVQDVIDEKEDGARAAEILLGKLEQIKDKIDEIEYKKIWIKFYNLKLVANIWKELVYIFINYVRYFETGEEKYKIQFESKIKVLEDLRLHGEDILGDDFYCLLGNEKTKIDFINTFINEIKESMDIEIRTVNEIEKENEVIDYVICGGGFEGHRLQKEVNFSDTLVKDGMLCRIPGNRKGAEWSSINAHGWFSYELKIKPNSNNLVKILMGSNTEDLSVQILIGEDQHIITEQIIGGKKEYTFNYNENVGNEFVRIRFDRISKEVPYIFIIKTC